MTLAAEIRRYPDGRVTAKDAAAYLGLSEKTLANMRTKGTGPKFVKIGKVFYFVSDLDAWLQSAVVTATCQSRTRMISRKRITKREMAPAKN